MGYSSVMRGGTRKSGRGAGAGAKPPCPLAGAMQFLSGAWTPFIIFYLREHPRRFGDLRRDIGEVSAKVLAARLRELEKLDVVSRTVKPTSPPTVEYALTPLGARLKPIIGAMAKVGADLAPQRASTTIR